MAFAMVCMLAGCSSDISKTAVYRPEDGKALVALGVRTNLTEYGLALYRFDPATKKLIKSDPIFISADSLYNFHPNDLAYRVSEIKPGEYVIMSINFQIGPMNRILCLNSGTLAFDVQPGAVNYIGDISFDSDYRLSFAGRDENALRAYLSSNMPNVSLPIKSAPSRMTTYELGKSLFGTPACPGFY